MKRLGLIMIAFILGICINTTAQQETTATAVSDSVIKNYQNVPKQTREDVLLEKLNPEQLLQLEKIRTKQMKAENPPLPAWSIALIVTSPFIMVVLIVFFGVRYQKEREKARYDLYLKSVESGQPLPEKIFEEPEKKTSKLQQGAVWLAVGLGAFVFGYFQNNSTLIGISAIPAFVGIAFLIVYFIERKHNNNDITA